MTMDDGNLLHAGIIFLAAAVIMVPVAQRLRIGAVLGYLLAGIAIGPWGWGLLKTSMTCCTSQNWVWFS